jgi:hypothetical protein
VDLDPVDSADDQQRRILKGLPVLEQLLVGRVEVGVLALVFPGEGATLPDVGPAAAAPLRRRAGLEGKGGAGRIRFRRRRMANEVTEIEKMLLRSRPLFQGCVPPLGDEVLWREGRPQGLRIHWGHSADLLTRAVAVLATT